MAVPAPPAQPAPTIYMATISDQLIESFLRVMPTAKKSVLKAYKVDGKISNLPNISVEEFETGDLVERVEILFADLPIIIRYRKELPNLKWVHSVSNGVDGWFNYVHPTEPQPTFTFTKTSGCANASVIAEFVVCHVLAREKRVFQSQEAQKTGRWEPKETSCHTRLLTSLTMGVLGAGTIGKTVARYCKSLGMRVWGLTRRPVTKETSCPDVDVYRTTEDLPEVLENCDYICSVLPSTPATRGLLSGDVLSHCQHKKSVVINVGRGDVVDEGSIARAVANGWIGGAVLDVFPEEPLPESSPLWRLPGVTVTPHHSGWSLDPNFVDGVTRCFVNNYDRYVAGEPLLNVLDWQQGY